MNDKLLTGASYIVIFTIMKANSGVSAVFHVKIFLSSKEHMINLASQIDAIIVARATLALSKQLTGSEFHGFLSSSIVSITIDEDNDHED